MLAIAIQQAECVASGQKVKIGLSGGVEPPGCPLPDSTDHFGRQFRTTVLFLQEEKSLFASIDVTFSYFILFTARLREDLSS